MVILLNDCRTIDQSVLIGLFSSLEINTPSGPSIITAGLILFLSLLKLKGVLN